MKAIIVCLLFCVSFATNLFANNLNFSDEVVSLFLNKDDTKVEGRLLPTNAFSIIETSGDRVKLRIEGFVNPKAPFVLYFNDSQRIIVAAFSKNTKLDFKKRIKGSGGKWDKVSIEVWAQKQDFATSNKEMLVKAKKMYMENCGICHSAHKESEFTSNQWQATFKSMVDRTGIDKKDRWLVIEYLQKNSKDFKEAK